MIIPTWQPVLDGSQTQIRILVKPNQTFDKFDERIVSTITCLPLPHQMTGKRRTLYQVGQTLAVQPGRGQKQVGRIRITGIRQERLQDITEEDAITGGIEIITPVYGDFQKTHLYPWADGQPAYYDYETTNWHKQTENGFCCCIEGQTNHRHAAVCSYKSLWDTIHTKPGTRWDDNPLTWVLSFELVKDF